MNAQEMAAAIKAAKRPVFMTGAGVSVPSGIPDYRSMTGIYTTSGLKEPEYLLSHRAMTQDTEDWYAFVKQLYHEAAEPNIIHEAMAQLKAPVITQNIDGLHRKAGSPDVVEFHGTIARHYCSKCGKSVTREIFLKNYKHEACGGLLRPDVVFYDEQIKSANIEHAIELLQAADAVFIVGTTFKVYPFASLINYANETADLYAINKDKVALPFLRGEFLGDAQEVFGKI